MGTWGTGPFDNDDAGDLVAQLAKPIHRVNEASYKLVPGRLRRRVSRRKLSKVATPTGYRRVWNHYDAARTAVQFVVLAHGTDIMGGPSIDACLKALERMRGDKEWIATWRKSSQKPLRAALDREIAMVKATMRACPACDIARAARKRIGHKKEASPLGVREAVREVVAANRARRPRTKIGKK